MKFAEKIILSLILTITLTPVCFAQKTTMAPIIPGDVKETKVELVLPHTVEGTTEGQFIGERFLPGLTKTIIALAGGFAFLFIVIGGIQILTAYGNEEKITTAKKTITFAIVGLLISILSYAIVSIISGIRLTPQKQQGTAQSNGQDLAPGTEDLTEAEKAGKDEGQYKEGSGYVIKGGVQKKD